MSAAADTFAISQETRDFLNREHKLFINGDWQDARTGDTMPVIDPATEAQISSIQLAGAEDVDAAVASASAAFKGDWSKLTSYQRTRMMLKLADLIDANMQTLAELEVLDNGLPMELAQYTIFAYPLTTLAAQTPRLATTTRLRL